MKSFQQIDRLLRYSPTLGILIFSALYYYSSTMYPGGSQADVHTVGYDWVNNYWCNLFNKIALNGQFNPARPYAITAMIVLCGSVLVFIIQFSRWQITPRYWRIVVQASGVLSMVFGSLLITPYHDLMTTLSSIFGVVVVIGIVREIYFSEHTFYKWTGLLCILLLALNNYIYYSKHCIELLPLIQKISFVVILSWIVGLNHKINNLENE